MKLPERRLPQASDGALGDVGRQLGPVEEELSPAHETSARLSTENNINLLIYAQWLEMLTVCTCYCQHMHLLSFRSPSLAVKPVSTMLMLRLRHLRTCALDTFLERLSC